MNIPGHSSVGAHRSPSHKHMTPTAATPPLLIGFVVSCNNNNLCVSNTTSAVLCQPNVLIHWVFGSFVSGVGDTLVSGCPWESCHCPVLRHYTHVETHSYSRAASSTTELHSSAQPQIHIAFSLLGLFFLVKFVILNRNNSCTTACIASTSPS